ncbi:MAG TPA: hypothetical protein VKU19_41515 [Bryobacteraceae bacterium]|nr:hypothetical protein [Bryobacteraceae bacterium]
MPILLQIPENPNCESLDGQVFQCRSASRAVTHVQWERDGAMEWCPIAAVNAGATFAPASACVVEDSGEGACYLVVGGDWGLRLRPSDGSAWDLSDLSQWGVTYLMLGGDGADLRFGE